MSIATQLTQKFSGQLVHQKINPTLFDYKKNPDLYWKALVHIAYGNKEAALKIVEMLDHDIPAVMILQEKSSLAINEFFEKLFLDSLSNDPQLLTRLGLFEIIGIKDHNKFLTDISAEALLQNIEKAKENLIYLESYSLENLSYDEKISHKIFSWLLRHAIAGEKFLFHEYKVNQMFGLIVEITSLFTRCHKLETEEDVENYISRLGKISEQINQTIEFLTLQENSNIIPPRFTIEKVITAIETLIPKYINKNIFYVHLEQHIDRVNLPNKNMILEKVLYIIKLSIYPAFNLLQEYFKKLLISKETNDGVWALPYGDEYYSYMLRHHTTTDLSADEIHAIGLAEVTKINKEIRKILVSENINDPHKEVGLLVRELSKNPEFYYQNTDEERKKCLSDYKAIIERARKELGFLFNIKPRAEVVVQQVPAHEEEGGPGAYYCLPSIDGSRPGIFFANLRNMNEEPKYFMESLTIHESEPGHHFQLSLQNEIDLPLLRKIMVHSESSSCTGYIEGWALYAEKLAYEYDFYSSSFAKIGYLQYELLRAARLVIDTGIHHKRWTREHAIEYMENTTGLHHDVVVTEIERYFVLPAQACSYKIGQLKIIELREKAQKMLNEKFKIQDFHNVVLTLGAVPLEILEEVVNNYIEEKLRV